MGNECMLKLKDAQAAIANFDKALLLAPTYVDAWIRKESPSMIIRIMIRLKYVLTEL